MRAIRTGLNAAGVPVESSKGEASAGQEEINVRYGEALAAADAHAIVKNGAKEIAWSKGRALTFMAKWDDRAAGSSSHVHQSLWTLDGAPAFFDPGEPQGMSKLMRSYLAGLLAHAGEITYFLAPYVNSYKRFRPAPSRRPRRSGRWTTAPPAIGWSARARSRCASSAGSAGPTSTPTSPTPRCIAAGIDGIERGLELEPEFRGDAYAAARVREIPTTLRDAAEALRRSEMLRAAFGDDVVDHYVHAARWEQSECDRRVTDWDRARGFERA